MAESSNTIFLLGAGFLRAMIPEAPLNNDLLGKIISSNSSTPLKKYQSKYNGTEDIEILLTRLDLEIAQHSSEKEQLKNDRKTIEYDISKYFEQFRFKKESLQTNKWLMALATQLFKDNDAIITTNYDCFLEGLLDYYNIWHIRKGYASVYDPSWMSNSPETKENPMGIKFYKIHGSENFRECKIFDDKGETKQTMIGFITNENIYPVSGKNSNLGWVEEFSEEYIVAPSHVKIPHFQIADMANKAVEVAKTAHNMVIIGSGLRGEDIFLWLILSGFINRTLPNKKNLIIIDPDACAVLEKTKNFLADNPERINLLLLPNKIEDCLGNLIKLLEDVKTNG